MLADDGLPLQVPDLLEWRTTNLSGAIVQVSIMRRDPGAPEIKRRVQKPWQPYGAEAWRMTGETDWRPLTTLPARWNVPDASGVPITHDDDQHVDRRSLMAEADRIYRERLKRQEEPPGELF